MSEKYILVGRNIVPEPDLLKWAEWFETADRIVEKTKIDDCVISTVFLGLNHNFSGEGEPILFETMVFGGKFDGEMARYSTWEQAEIRHKEMIKKVKV